MRGPGLGRSQCVGRVQQCRVGRCSAAPAPRLAPPPPVHHLPARPAPLRQPTGSPWLVSCAVPLGGAHTHPPTCAHAHAAAPATAGACLRPAGNSPVQIHKRQFAGLVDAWFNLSIAIKKARCARCCWACCGPAAPAGPLPLQGLQEVSAAAPSVVSAFCPCRTPRPTASLAGCRRCERAALAFSPEMLQRCSGVAARSARHRGTAAQGPPTLRPLVAAPTPLLN